MPSQHTQDKGEPTPSRPLKRRRSSSSRSKRRLVGAKHEHDKGRGELEPIRCVQNHEWLPDPVTWLLPFQRCVSGIVVRSPVSSSSSWTILSTWSDSRQLLLSPRPLPALPCWFLFRALFSFAKQYTSSRMLTVAGGRVIQSSSKESPSIFQPWAIGGGNSSCSDIPDTLLDLSGSFCLVLN
ncbi:uncharacterized protein KZ484_020459 [Pholidichthys leucotaenia]